MISYMWNVKQPTRTKQPQLILRVIKQLTRKAGQAQSTGHLEDTTEVQKASDK